MLKKEQLDAVISSGTVKPRFLASGDPQALECADMLLAIYSSAVESGMNRDLLEEETSRVIQCAARKKIAGGMNKLLLDRCEFALGQEQDYPELRRRHFAAAALALKSGKLPAAPQEIDLYGDLPGLEKLTAMKPLTSPELIDRYNLAQAQGLFCFALEVQLTIADPDTAELRRVMKAIKFFRLLAEFRRETGGAIRVTISGPYALFGPVTKYAVSLASLLPVIVRLKQWHAEAEVRYHDRQLKLRLSEKSGLRSMSRSFSSFIPEEIRLYHRLFAEKSTDWEIVGGTPFLDAGEQEILFPDLSFRRKSDGKTLHVELFHRWHAGQLEKRFKLLARHPELPLLLGIDRSLLGDDDALTEATAFAPGLRERCWLFRDFPGVENTLRALGRAAALPGKE